MPPYLGNETITRIFERLYDSLCIHPAHVEPDVPIGAKFVFSQLALVSKRFHSLALPFLVRHFDGRNVEAFTALIEQRGLASSVKSFYLDPQLFGFKNPTPFERWPKGRSFLRASQSRSMRQDAMEKVQAIHDEARQREFKRWEPLLKLCVPHLNSIEIGSRRRNKSQRGPYVGECDLRAEEDFEDYESFSMYTAPSLELEYYLRALPVSLHVTSVRLNLPAEPKSIETNDWQYSQRLAKLFPSLENLTLHLHNDYELPGRADDYTNWRFPSLKTLRILNARCKISGILFNFLPTFLVPSAETLRHLEVQTTSNIPLVDEVFGELKFPALETLIIDAVIALLGGKNHPVLPKSLQHIAFTRVTNSKVEATTNFLKYGLHTGALQGLRYYVLEGAITPNDDEAPEASDAPSILGNLIKVCEKEGIELFYEGAIDDGSIEFQDVPGEPLSEDDEFDYEAEEGEEFRNRWSKEKMRDHEINEAFSHLRRYLKSDSNAAKAREALNPFLS